MLSGESVAGVADDVGVAGTRGVPAISDVSVLAAVESMEAAWLSVTKVPSGALVDADKRALLVRMETLSRAMYGTSHTWLTELVESDGLAVMPERTNASRLACLLRINAGVAGKRIAMAAKLAARRALTGESLEPVYPSTAAALCGGHIDAAHAVVIDKFFGRLPAAIDLETREQSEVLLAELAKELSPEHLQVAADRLQILLDPDGSLGDDKDPVAKCFFRLGKQDADGLSKGSFVVDSEFRAYLEAVLAKLAKPGNCNADEPTPVVGDDPESTGGDGSNGTGGDATGGDGEGSGGGPGDPTLFDGPGGRDPENPSGPGPGPDTGTGAGTEADRRAGRDTRTPGQRNHDAIKAVLRQMLASGSLGEHRGLPVTAIITMTSSDLETASGHAVTGTGSLVPIRDAIRMASHAHQYLAIFDDTDGRALYLGRSKRIASADQRIVLIARDRGCTFPGCIRPATWCQAHHIDEWDRGGNTDVDSLTFGCDLHHPLVGDGPNHWATTTTGPQHRTPGRTQWHPPESVDPDRRGIVNRYHHPQEYLYHDPDTEP